MLEIRYKKCKNFFFNQYQKIKNQLVPHVISEHSWTHMPKILDAAVTNTLGAHIFFEIIFQFFPPIYGWNTLFNILKYTADNIVFFTTIYYQSQSYHFEINQHAGDLIHHANRVINEIEEIFLADDLLLKSGGFEIDKIHYIAFKEDISNVSKHSYPIKKVEDFPFFSEWYKNLGLSSFTFQKIHYMLMYAMGLTFIMHETGLKKEKNTDFLKKQIHTLRKRVQEWDNKLGSEEELKSTLAYAKNMISTTEILRGKIFSPKIMHFSKFYLFLESEFLILFSAFLRSLVSTKGIHIFTYMLWPEWKLFNLFVSMGALFKFGHDEYQKSTFNIRFQKEMQNFSSELFRLQNNKMIIAKDILFCQKKYLQSMIEHQKEMTIPASFHKRT